MQVLGVALVADEFRGCEGQGSANLLGFRVDFPEEQKHPILLVADCAVEAEGDPLRRDPLAVLCHSVVVDREIIPCG